MGGQGFRTHSVPAHVRRQECTGQSGRVAAEPDRAAGPGRAHRRELGSIEWVRLLLIRRCNLPSEVSTLANIRHTDHSFAHRAVDLVPHHASPAATGLQFAP